MQNQSQNRAHKLNIGILKAHDAKLIQLDKDRRKRINTVDQELLEAYKFLEQVKTSTGNAINAEDIFKGEKFKQNRKLSLLKEQRQSANPSKSSILKMEVKLRKALCEARFRYREKEFFKKWDDALNIDLELDSWNDGEDEAETTSEWMELPTTVSKSFIAK